jgi:hypothetical protein
MLDHEPDTDVDYIEEIAATARQQLLGVVPEQVARLRWDVVSLARYRSARLTETLSFVPEQSLWHADRLSSLDLESLTPEDLTSLPTMSKADVMDAWDRIVTDSRLSLDAVRQHLARVDDGRLPFLLDKYVAFTAGGTMDQAGAFVWSVEEFARGGASAARFGIDAGDPPAKRLTFVAAPSLPQPSAWPPLLLHGQHAGSRQSVPIDQPVAAIVEQLNLIAPDRPRFAFFPLRRRLVFRRYDVATQRNAEGLERVRAAGSDTGGGRCPNRKHANENSNNDPTISAQDRPHLSPSH